MELSELPGKPVLSPAGEALGYVKCAYVCKNFDKLSCLACVDGEEEEYYIPMQAVKGIGDAVIASPTRLKTASGLPSPVGKGVFDRFGNFLGAAGGFDPEKGLLFVQKSGGCAVFPAAFLSVEEAVIVYETAEQKPAPHRKNVQKNAKRTTKKGTETTPLPHAENTVHKFFLPSAPISGTNLLGKQVKKSVYSENGKLVSAGETVTPVVLKRAREHNRLIELAANTLTE